LEIHAVNGNDILKLGYKTGKIIGVALNAAKTAEKSGLPESTVLDSLKTVMETPDQFTDDPFYSEVAEAILAERGSEPDPASIYDLDHPAPFDIWGKDGIDPNAIEQMKRAVRLPVAVRGALMPDAHQGYGLPIGGVLATENSVIPYAVGVDIACRMRMSIFDASPYVLEQKKDKYRRILENNTIFGTGKTWDEPRDHEVMSDPIWQQISIARQFRDVAWKQLGTSGSGNHFVEFGALMVTSPIMIGEQTVAPGKYLALLSHSGSRRLGQEIANHYTEIAKQQRITLPKDFVHLAWLDLDNWAGAEYWAAMTLAGRYASANHAIIHEQIADSLSFELIGTIENHHNYAWKEVHGDREVVVHRKGATPAGKDILGVIPGSMTAPGYVVRGLGKAASLESASHGAGRRMSRAEAFKRFDWAIVKKKLKTEGGDLLSAGLDETPGAYKDIHQVMAAQSDLVDTLAEFQPKLVKMDPGNGRIQHGESID
jgi:tRNA-splicing ligase RtcB